MFRITLFPVMLRKRSGMFAKRRTASGIENVQWLCGTNARISSEASGSAGRVDDSPE